ncbi:unnamed protein product [Linum trigynum]|uniref:Uncharacterized protein n=1 Tax=Linum trigynum TaxID=586398 RepID=A0AAV2GYK9_9ROSI
MTFPKMGQALLRIKHRVPRPCLQGVMARNSALQVPIRRLPFQVHQMKSPTLLSSQFLFGAATGRRKVSCQ